MNVFYFDEPQMALDHYEKLFFSNRSKLFIVIATLCNFQSCIGYLGRYNSYLERQSMSGSQSYDFLPFQYLIRLQDAFFFSVSSQLSKNNSFRHHRSTIGGPETPAQMYSQPISSTTPTLRESVVFNRGDDKPF
ncbi:hypothetical protein BpHYR1_052955, partial [Brachionus plicatilis]